MKKRFCVGLAIALSGQLAGAQQDFSKVEIKATHVSGNIHMLEGAGGNIAVSTGPDGLLIVDDQFAPLAEKIEAALAKLGPGRLKFVLNTHFHGDHTGGNAHFGKEATIIAQTNVRKRLSSGASVKGGLPVVTFDSSLSVHFNGEEIKLLHLAPGHTDGDSIVLFTQANVVHAGDQFFSGRFPNIDLASGGDVRGYIRNVEQLLQKLPAGARLIPGHGPLSSRKELEEFHEMLVATSGLVEKAVSAGKSLDQVKAEGLPDRWKKWEAPTLSVERWLEILYRGLTTK
jgi:glyoxylase-like metal-dependent hydrolase (beta-lactamase superfamily II)